MLVGLRLRVLELLRLNGSPHGIGLGFALGFSLSLIPIPFLGMVVALALAPLVRANPTATYFGSAVVNPLTGPAFYFGELWIGARLLALRAPTWVEAQALDGREWMDLFGELLPAFGLGVAVVSSVAAALSYPALRWATAHIQDKHRDDQ